MSPSSRCINGYQQIVEWQPGNFHGGVESRGGGGGGEGIT